MLMFPSEDRGRFSVSDDGTLFVDSVRREDSGLYVCKALSASGIAVARATLDVRGHVITCRRLTGVFRLRKDFAYY